MARKALHIVANDAVKRVLGSLGSPLAQVAVEGRMVSDASGNTLVIENVSTPKSAMLPIIPNAATKKALGEVASGDGPRQVTLIGRVVKGPGGNVLLLDQMGKGASLPIIAEAAKKPKKTLLGICADLGVSISAGAIAEARREMWGTFPRDI